MSIDKPYLACSKNTQHIGATCCSSKFNIDDHTFDDDDELLCNELLDDDDVDDNGRISNFEDEESAIGLHEYEILENFY